jgi:hypothetical protein
MAIKTGQLRLILPNGEERVYGSADSVAPQVPAGESCHQLQAPWTVLQEYPSASSTDMPQC